jgi:hypothetical protein
MSQLEVESRVSLHRPPDRTRARWNIHGDSGSITLFLPPIWDDASVSPQFHEDDLVDFLVLQIGHTYLLERICLERAHEKIKIKGGRCEPSCHVAPVAEFMTSYLIERVPA